MTTAAKTLTEWSVKPSPPAEFIRTSENIPPLIATLLWHRGLTTEEAIQAFLNPDYEKHVPDPLLFRHMQKAVSRVVNAVNQSEKITVFGDYDADGVCGAAILHEFLNKIGALHEVYIPDRSSEAFGLSEKAVRGFHSGGAKLLITIDCGVTDYNEIELANSLGIDTIVLDHHVVPPLWPNAYAIIDHKHPDETYPGHVLSGTGLSFKLVQALARYGNFGIPNGWEKWLLDLVAIAAIADMVPLTGENRALTHYGLTVLRKTKRIGLQQMFAIAGRNPRDADTETISHFIAPRINAASRMDKAENALILLTTENEEEARYFARRLEEKNGERKLAVESMLENLEKKIGASPLPTVIFEGSGDWTPGILGLAAARLVEKYCRPVFLYSANGELIKGSCRSPEGIDVVGLMAKTADLFSDFGGHTMAGGFSILPERLPLAKERLLNAGEEIGFSEEEKRIEADAELSLDEIDEATYKMVHTLEPFGQGNPRPLFLVRNAFIRDIRRVGGGNHIKMRLGERGVGAIYFRARQNGFGAGDRIDILAELQENVWNGKRSIELRIINARNSS